LESRRLRVEQIRWLQNDFFKTVKFLRFDRILNTSRRGVTQLVDIPIIKTISTLTGLELPISCITNENTEKTKGNRNPSK
jgi:hypothetical protein